jgi:GNAT superfamily N-acetyltransferase
MTTPTPAPLLEALSFRETASPDDAAHVRRIVASTAFFNPAEIDVAVELVTERLARGPASGYHFLFAERAGRPVGYACFGPIAGAEASFDLFWIAVEAAERGRGIGRALLDRSESAIAAMGGRRVYVETSSRDQYAPTRRFYERAGYIMEATLADFYGPADAKAIFVKALG